MVTSGPKQNGPFWSVHKQSETNTHYSLPKSFFILSYKIPLFLLCPHFPPFPHRSSPPQRTHPDSPSSPPPSPLPKFRFFLSDPQPPSRQNPFPPIHDAWLRRIQCRGSVPHCSFFTLSTMPFCFFIFSFFKFLFLVFGFSPSSSCR